MKKTFFLSILTLAMLAMLSSCAVNLGGVAANYSPLNNYRRISIASSVTRR